jgi:hypothetical protein
MAIVSARSPGGARVHTSCEAVAAEPVTVLRQASQPLGPMGAEWTCPGFVDTKVMGHCAGALKR